MCSDDKQLLLILIASGGKERNGLGGGYIVSGDFFLRQETPSKACKNLIKFDPAIAIVYCIIVSTCIYVCDLSQ